MSSKILIIFAFVLIVLALLIIPEIILQAKPLIAYSAPTQVTVQMYRLDQDGVATTFRCTTDDINWGCTAFCGTSSPRCASGPIRPYPYSSDTPSIQIESDYLLDVVAHEAFPSILSATAVEANTVAARSFTYGHISATHTIDNSTNKHVFVPYRFESLNPTVTPNNPANVCNSTNLNLAQQKVCSGVARRYYMSYGTAPNDDYPATTEYFSDIPNATISGTAPYEVSVADPISSDPAIIQFGHGRGMSQNGASRWGYGNMGYRGNLTPWSVQWAKPEQILHHYYTGVHLRDASNNNTRLTPTYRWNPLAVNWGNGATEPLDMQVGQTYNVTIQVQNTGAVNWGSDVRLSCQWQKPDGSRVNCQTQANPGTLTMGDPAPNVTLPVRLNNGLPNGHYTLIIDMKQGANFFHQREAGKPWPTLNYKVCAGGNCSESYFPIIMKRWTGLQCNDYATTIWYPTGNNSCNPSSISGCAQADGEPDGVYAGPFNLNQSHQVEFTPQLIRPETTIGTYWKKYSGDYAHLYSYIKVDDVWVSLPVDQFQGSGTAVWRWTNRGIGQYAGQYISGIQFKGKKSNPIANMRLIIDGYRIRDFTSCTR